MDELKKYIDTIKKIEYIEDMVRLSTQSNSPYPLYQITNNPELYDIAKKYLRFESDDAFIAAIKQGINYKQLFDTQFSGELILFHTRKFRDFHFLPNLHMIYSFEGGCNIYIQDKTVSLLPGNVCIISPGVRHSYYDISANSLTIHAAISDAFIGRVMLPDFHQINIFTDYFRDLVMNHNVNIPYISFSCDDTYAEERRAFIAAAFYHHSLRTPLYDENVNFYMNHFFFLLFLSASQENSYIANYSRKIPSTNEQLLNYINENCATVTLKHLAALFHFNSNYMSQYIKKNFNTTFMSLVQNARMAKASHLLTDSSIPITDIAEQVGYSNMNYFYNLFKKTYGFSPADYRAKYRSSENRTIMHEKDRDTFSK